MEQTKTNKETGEIIVLKKGQPKNYRILTERKIYSSINLPPYEKSKSGNGYIQKVHKWILNKEKGIKEWKHVADTNLDKIIQENAKTNDLTAIAKQIAIGNGAVLEAKKGIYCDATQLPNNIHEAAEMAHQLNSLYENNPVLKEIYQNKKAYQEDFLKGKVIEKVETWHKKQTDKLNQAKEKAYNDQVKAQAKLNADIEKAKGETK